MSILDQLNPEQQKAVRAINGPVLVLAGAGSGKTRTLTHRIVYLIHQKGVNPRQILAVTFTNKAASEMKERVKVLLKNIQYPISNIQYQPLIGTFHSVCARILREDISPLGYRSSFTIFDVNDQLSAIKHVLAEMQLSAKDFNPKTIAKIIEKAKREMIGPNEFKLKDSFDDRIERVYQHYQKYLQEINALDFGDLLFKVNELWRKHPLILEKYQKRWHYVLVDEYQDTNLAQYEFCRQLVLKHQNLFVVGDDYQSIYSFRGADLTNILNFNRDYPQARVILLEQNYRSTRSILNLANIIIKKNKAQKEKVLWTMNKKGVLPQIMEVEDEQEEAEFIINKISAQGQSGKANLNNFVVLYRTNAQSRSLEEAMLYYNAPYRIIGGIRFYDRKEIKDILAYLKALGNPRDFINLGRIINTPVRGIGPATLQEFFRYMRNKKLDIIQMSLVLSDQKPSELPDNIYKKVRPFCLLVRDLIKALPSLTVSQLIETAAQKFNYLDYLKSVEENFEERLENIKELKTVAERFSGIKGQKGLQSFLEDVALMTDIDALDERQNAVTLMTVHAVKGLEFDHVFMAGMEQGLFPHSASLFNTAGLEEERRLCYVGVTRARQSLYLIHARGRTIYGSTAYNEPSEFIEELDESVVERVVL